jgi:sterol desaturase/sphingolipid hydroxylase (fatty acid hydroxylase superfamily)
MFMASLVLYSLFWLQPGLDRQAAFEWWFSCREEQPSILGLITVMSLLVFWIPMTLTFIYDWVIGVMYAAYFDSYKIAVPVSETVVPLTLNKRAVVFREVAARRAKTLMFLTLPAAFLSEHTRAWLRQQCDAEFPSREQVVWQCMSGFFLASTVFYACHRALHHPRFYHLHKEHHEYKAPIAAATDHAHPMEGLVGMSMVIGPIWLFQMHLWTLVLFHVASVSHGLYEHCGYHLPLPLTHWMPFAHNASRAHNAHHQRFTGNYGAFFPFWDRLLGTVIPEEEPSRKKKL